MHALYHAHVTGPVITDLCQQLVTQLYTYIVISCHVIHGVSKYFSTEREHSLEVYSLNRSHLFKGFSLGNRDLDIDCGDFGTIIVPRCCVQVPREPL